MQAKEKPSMPASTACGRFIGAERLIKDLDLQKGDVVKIGGDRLPERETEITVICDNGAVLFKHDGIPYHPSVVKENLSAEKRRKKTKEFITPKTISAS